MKRFALLLLAGALGIARPWDPLARTQLATTRTKVAALLPAPSGPPPRDVWGAEGDARALATDGDHLWVATRGGVARIGLVDGERWVFDRGLDTLDVRGITVENHVVIARTAGATCRLAGETFQCRSEPTATSAPAVGTGEKIDGHAVTARLEVGARSFASTRGGGVYETTGGRNVASARGVHPAGFVHTGVRFRDALWLGGFDDGLYRVPLTHGELPADLSQAAVRVSSPARLANRLVASEHTLFVASNEGIFSTRDGQRFERLTQIKARAITGLALGTTGLWVASSEAVYRLAASGRGRILESHVYPAGTHSIQDLSVSADGTVWLASEDRGVVRLRGDEAVAFDRLAALPSSWFTAVESDGEGGAFATTLRHGAIHLGADGSWSALAWAPGSWGLGVDHAGNRLCVGMQNGASCTDAYGVATPLGSLPDPRVHFFVQVGSSLLVGTEAGLARYDG